MFFSLFSTLLTSILEIMVQMYFEEIGNAYWNLLLYNTLFVELSNH